MFELRDSFDNILVKKYTLESRINVKFSKSLQIAKWHFI